jgi:hypothetical protein
MVNIPPPKQPRPKAPEKKPSLFGERTWIETKIISKELGKGEYFSKLGIPKEKREKIGSILADKRILGEKIYRGSEDILKLRSLITELKSPGTSAYSSIREAAKKIRQEIGEYKAKELANILKEKFGL